MWIHEGWTTYLECLYVEYMYGKDDGLKYTNAYNSKVKNQQPIIAPRGVNATPPQDMYKATERSTKPHEAPRNTGPGDFV